MHDICRKGYTFLHCPHSSGSGGVCVHNNLLHVVDSHCCVVLLLLDSSATFDTVDYNLLLNRLESKFATRGKALQSFKSYLSQYSQFVSINLDKSLSQELNCGVPQGFVLDPVLYLFYTSPVADILRRHNMAFKLRNCMLMTPSCMLLSPATMTWDYNLPWVTSKKCLHDIHLWMTANKLKLNKDKTELSYFYSNLYSLHTSFIPLHFGADLI